MVDGRNEQGYALVSVLLIIVIFSVLSLSFMGQAFSSVKQNQEVEKNTQSVAISEMGVSYYQVAIQNLFEQKKDEVALKVKNNIYNQGDESKVIEFLRSSLETGIKNIPDPPKVDGDSSFKLDKGLNKIKVTSSNNEIKMELSILGTKSGKSTSLHTEMIIYNLSTIKIKSTSVGTPEFEYKEIELKKSDVTDAGCINPLSLEIDKKSKKKSDGTNICSKVFIDEPLTGKIYNVANQNKFAVNNTLYSTIDLTLDGNFNNTQVLDIYSKSLTLGDNFNNGANLNIETKYDLTFSKNVQNLSNSNFYIGGHLIAPGQFDLENDSHVWVRGTKATGDTHTKSRIEKKLRIDATSSMCVNGDLAIEAFNNFNGKLYIKGIVTNLSGQKLEHANITYVTESNQNSFISQCGKTFDSPSSASIDWKDTSNTNINEVTY